MSVLNLSLVPNTIHPGGFAVGVRIDGELLTERVRKIEVHHRQTAGKDPAPCRYTWVRAGVLLRPGRHLLGVPNSPWCPGFSEVLVCTCGEAACGAIAVSVRVGPRHVGWLAWRQFPLAEACPRCEFRPVLFARPQYQTELERVSEEFRQRHGEP